MKKIIFGLMFITFALMSNAMVLTADDTARIGQTLGIKIQMETLPINNIACSIYTTSNDKDMLDLLTYDSILNEPTGLKSNAAGFAFANIQITAKYPVDSNFKVYAYCGNESSSSSFKVLSFTPTDTLANALISVKDNPIGWIIIIIVIAVIIGLIKILLKSRL